MRVRPMTVTGGYEFVPPVFPDARGLFVAPFQEAAFRDATGQGLHVAQSNHSVSRQGVVRGIHFVDVPPGQAKYIYCPRGALLDVAVDVRVGSPTYGSCDAVRLDADSCRAVYLPEGIGHAFLALAADTVLAYLCSTPYNPAAERTVHPLDPALNLPWPADVDPVLSDKDAAAPTLEQAAESGFLPSWQDCQARYAQLRAG